MDVCSEKDIHDQRTKERLYFYCFTPKHHDRCAKSDSRWLKEMPRPEEFQVFNMADYHELKDADGDLYGLRISGAPGSRRLLELGDKHEQVARFWAEGRPTDPWHGHPLWPLRSRDAGNRAKQNCCPPVEVFDLMVEKGILPATKANRLKTGKHVGKLDGG